MMGSLRCAQGGLTMKGAYEQRPERDEVVYHAFVSGTETVETKKRTNSKDLKQESA